jgi:hypothetical protein
MGSAYISLRTLNDIRTPALGRPPPRPYGKRIASLKGNGLMPKGSCLCGAVRFEVAAELPAPDACHCTQCRKWSGHYFASTDVPREALAVQGEEHVTWYPSSAKVRRGFCSICGSSLFWDPLHRDWTAIAMGAFEAPTGTRMDKHIFTADKGDYYDIEGDLPQHERPPG